MGPKFRRTRCKFTFCSFSHQRMRYETTNKCIFAVSELQFLGHKISSRGLTPVESKVQDIVNAQCPADALSRLLLQLPVTEERDEIIFLVTSCITKAELQAVLCRELAFR